jgi:hypothetical protein
VQSAPPTESTSETLLAAAAPAPAPAAAGARTIAAVAVESAEERALRQMAAMGFCRAVALASLEASGGDVAAAIERIVAEQKAEEESAKKNAEEAAAKKGAQEEAAKKAEEAAAAKKKPERGAAAKKAESSTFVAWLSPFAWLAAAKKHAEEAAAIRWRTMRYGPIGGCGMRRSDCCCDSYGFLCRCYCGCVKSIQYSPRILALFSVIYLCFACGLRHGFMG